MLGNGHDGLGGDGEEEAGDVVEARGLDVLPHRRLLHVRHVVLEEWEAREE